MIEREIADLAKEFRTAIEAARDAGDFSSDFSFHHFPRGCCGDTSYLFAEYLNEHGYETIWVSTSRGDWTHAWLILKNERVKEPTPITFEWPEELQVIVKGYGVVQPENPVDITRYEATDIDSGLIIDITSDQFNDWDTPVYVGYLDAFHRTFEFEQAHDYDGLNDLDGRLRRLYRIVQRYL